MQRPRLSAVQTTTTRCHLVSLSYPAQHRAQPSMRRYRRHGQPTLIALGASLPLHSKTRRGALMPGMAKASLNWDTCTRVSCNPFRLIQSVLKGCRDKWSSLYKPPQACQPMRSKQVQCKAWYGTGRHMIRLPKECRCNMKARGNANAAMIHQLAADPGSNRDR